MNDTKPRIGLVAATASGIMAAKTLAIAWPDEVRHFEAARPADALRQAFAECEAVVSFLAVGATVRVLAPLLGHKTTDAAVVCVDEGLRYAVPVLGGHHGGNALAHRLAEVFGCEAVITTASDAAGLPALDSLGADLGVRIENPEVLARVGARMISGSPIAVSGAASWPLPALPPHLSEAHQAGTAVAEIVISDTVQPGESGGDADGRSVSPGRVTEATVSITTSFSVTPNIEDLPGTGVVPDLLRLDYRPPSLVVGVGASRGVTAEEVLEAVDSALAAGNLSPLSVVRLASVEAKADEAGILEAAGLRGWPVVFHPATALADIDVPNPSEVVLAEVGTPSVAEAAARYDGRNRPLADLVVPKTRSAREVPMATAAVARLRPRGRLAVVGLGPGARDLLAPRAVAELRRSSVVIGLDQYVDQIRDLLRPGTEIRATGLGSEEARARDAVETARTGKAVALIGSGDAGMYAMASPALDLFEDLDDVDVVGVPGITASLAASNLLGAPLGHDHAVISLSDLHTPWEAIERRVRAAAEGDFVTVFYNPRSRGRDWQLGKALEILAAHRPATTPVGCVRDASRPGEQVWTATLADFDPARVDMYTVVLVGSSQSRLAAGRMVTPRGYKWQG